ncbi:hypothetical protein AZE42_12320 [Rhizopogon vesiculosus]|uniref:Uncharacterized protein n=1 Tax=Rhizopogon vesiculosus TaxID=180088 RepID=A0A1J8PW74_9AGAM|nr:hypothetical protein AZE42_12320 [Rhizopogon vesiculosus]
MLPHQKSRSTTEPWQDTSVLNHFAPSKRRRQAHDRVLPRYGDNFWGHNANRSRHRSAARTTDPPPRRNLFHLLRFNVRPIDAPQPLPLQPRRGNFSFFTGRTSVPTVDVAAAQDVERYGIAPPTEAEVAAAMAAALPQVSSNAANSQMPQGQAAAGIQGSHVNTQGQHPSPGVEDPSYEMGCCGICVHFGLRQSK